MILRSLILVVLAVLGSSLPGWAETPEGKRPLYSKKLQMPLRGDEFRSPQSVVAELVADEVFVCDPLYHRIAIFDRDGLFKYEITGGITFRAPIDLAVDADGFLYVLGTHKGDPGIVHLDFDGRFLGFHPLNGLPGDPQYLSLRSIAISHQARRLYIVDQWTHKLYITDLTGNVEGYYDFEEGRTEDEIENLRLGRVDVYGDSVLMAVVSDGDVLMLDLDGNLQRRVGQKGATECMLMWPTAAALDELDRVIILDLQRSLFQVWDPEANKCLYEYYGFGGQPGALYNPRDIALDRNGQIFIAQGYDGRVQMYPGAEPAAFLAPPEDSDARDLDP